MKFGRLGAILLAAALAATFARADDLLIRGARVHTAGPVGTLDGADVLVRNGRIAQVGRRLPIPIGVAVVEAAGQPLTPGLFAGITQLGLEEVNLEAATVDAKLEFAQPAWMHQWRPEFDVARAFNPRSPVIAVTRVEGMTWTVLAPVGDKAVVAGQGAAVALHGRDGAVLGGKTLFVRWGSAALPAAGGSRAAQPMLFDQAIRETRDPAAAGAGALLQPEGRKALKYFLGGGRVAFRAHRASDIRAAVEYAKRLGMKPLIVGGSEAWIVARELAAAQVPVILDALDNLPTDFDHLAARLDNAKLLQEAGVTIAFSLNDDAHHARKNRQLAGNAAAHGLAWDAALAALTSAPARIFGLPDHGAIEKGKVADLVLWTGDPLEVTTVAARVWIGGQEVEMRSRQTALRDRYLELLRSNRGR